jgi:hypothetical protein
MKSFVSLRQRLSFSTLVGQSFVLSFGQEFSFGRKDLALGRTRVVWQQASLRLVRRNRGRVTEVNRTLDRRERVEQIVGPEPREATFASTVIRLELLGSSVARSTNRYASRS